MYKQATSIVSKGQYNVNTISLELTVNMSLLHVTGGRSETYDWFVSERLVNRVNNMY